MKTSIIFDSIIKLDPRFEKLCWIKDEDSAIGLLIRASFLDSFYKGREEKNIPSDMWQAQGLDELIDADFAVQVGGKVYLLYNFEVKKNG